MRGHLEEHVNRLYHYCLRLAREHHVAEDLTQETLLRAWRRRGDLRASSATRVWLFRIATNIWRDRLRRGRLERKFGGSFQAPAEEIADDASRHAAQDLARREELERVLVLIDTLPDRQREVLWLYALEGLSQKEIADVLAIKTSTVKVNLHHARRAMRRKLAEATSADGISADNG